MPKPLIYIAAPLFNEGERALNDAIRTTLIDAADVYLRQLDGTLLAEAIERGEAPEFATKEVFRRDIEALQRCDILLIVLNGRVVDEGAAFELGVAWALGKTCVAFKNDPRQLLAIGDNPMIAQAVSASSEVLCR
ncbi:nucleoside 2-deoxyribosyltransferase [Sinorhizobium americanum]|uniref:Nucleoside 2-deoxyribosyltransferase-like protein n=1 Tax=Sinorhizobium americanum TaxID=194963 RepID=A0A4R2BII3_9HYPH|nr:nucleoside 2-deoxyribosyltransferase [Sinorhizobium americanum]TCN26928.1 nucleoside 2-deoxyribosyltransferase-like protein [Sinorhizobium americanum]